MGRGDMIIVSIVPHIQTNKALYITPTGLVCFEIVSTHDNKKSLSLSKAAGEESHLLCVNNL